MEGMLATPPSFSTSTVEVPSRYQMKTKKKRANKVNTGTANNGGQLPYEVLIEVIRYLAAKEWLKLMLVSKTFKALITDSDMITMSDVVNNLAITGSTSAIKSLHSIRGLLARGSIYFPSPMRVLRICSGKVCERCLEVRCFEVRSEWGLSFCHDCILSATVDVWLGSRAKATVRIVGTLESTTRLCTYSMSKQLYLLKSPYTARGSPGELVGPLITRSQLSFLQPLDPQFEILYQSPSGLTSTPSKHQPILETIDLALAKANVRQNDREKEKLDNKIKKKESTAEKIREFRDRVKGMLAGKPELPITVEEILSTRLFRQFMCELEKVPSKTRKADFELVAESLYRCFAGVPPIGYQQPLSVLIASSDQDPLSAGIVRWCKFQQRQFPSDSLPACWLWGRASRSVFALLLSSGGNLPLSVFFHILQAPCDSLTKASVQCEPLYLQCVQSMLVQSFPERPEFAQVNSMGSFNQQSSYYSSHAGAVYIVEPVVFHPTLQDCKRDGHFTDPDHLVHAAMNGSKPANLKTRGSTIEHHSIEPTPPPHHVLPEVVASQWHTIYQVLQETVAAMISRLRQCISVHVNNHAHKSDVYLLCRWSIESVRTTSTSTATVYSASLMEAFKYDPKSLVYHANHDNEMLWFDPYLLRWRLKCSTIANSILSPDDDNGKAADAQFCGASEANVTANYEALVTTNPTAADFVSLMHAPPLLLQKYKPQYVHRDVDFTRFSLVPLMHIRFEVSGFVNISTTNIDLDINDVYVLHDVIKSRLSYSAVSIIYRSVNEKFEMTVTGIGFTSACVETEKQLKPVLSWASASVVVRKACSMYWDREFELSWSQLPVDFSRSVLEHRDAKMLVRIQDDMNPYAMAKSLDCSAKLSIVL